MRCLPSVVIQASRFPVADDETVAVINRYGPGVPKGVTHPADRGNSIGEAEALGKAPRGVNWLPQHAE